MRRALPALLFLVLVAGCGPSSIGDLARPALVAVVTEPGGFCSTTYALDGSGTLWLADGCSTDGSLHAHGSVSASDRSELSTAMDQLLAMPDDPACDPPSPSARQYRFSRTAAGTSDWPETRLCGPSLPDAARTFVRRLAIDDGLDGGTDAGSPPDAGIDAGL